MNKEKVVVFVYGVFNILHPGHLRLLKFAKESGDYLVVAVSSDKMTNIENVLDEKMRLEFVQATNYVDEAFILDGNPEDYIRERKPNIVVKGKEHEYGENKELEILKSYGGKLIFTSGMIGFSSLNLLRSDFENIEYSNIKHSTEYLDRHRIRDIDLVETIQDFKKLNVLVIGDTIIDEYVTCDPLGMSQEDPTIVVTPISTDRFIGGAAIVASHAKSLGANVTFISVLGDDEGYNFMQNRLSSLGVNLECYTDSTRPTTLKQRFRANGKTLLRLNHLKQHQIDKSIEEQILKNIEKEIEKIDLIVFSDFSYGVLSDSLISGIEEIVGKHNTVMVADSQSSSQIGDISKFRGMNLVTPTEREIRLSLNDFDSGLVILSKALYKKSNPKYIVTTLGNEGIIIYDSTEKSIPTDRIPALNLYPKDIAGAGDSFLICASMALSLGVSIWQSAYLGSMAAAIQVGRIGNIPISSDEMIRELDI